MGIKSLAGKGFVWMSICNSLGNRSISQAIGMGKRVLNEWWTLEVRLEVVLIRVSKKAPRHLNDTKWVLGHLFVHW